MFLLLFMIELLSGTSLSLFFFQEGLCLKEICKALVLFKRFHFTFHVYIYKSTSLSHNFFSFSVSKFKPDVLSECCYISICLNKNCTKNATPPGTPERIAVLLQALFYFVARPFAGPEIILLKLRYYIAALLLLN